PPTLVVLDIMMPGMDGLTLIRHLKHRQPDVRIVATSGLATYQSAALAAGASAFLPKPYDFRDLLKTIADLLRCPSPTTPLRPCLQRRSTPPSARR
ncbi:MAG: hypothetical protein DCF32_17495, partial [Leptolyngbya sp.]